MNTENNEVAVEIDKSWTELVCDLTCVAVGNALARRNYFMLNGCNTYVKCFQSIGKKVVLISNVTASKPGTGQFRSMLIRLEEEARKLGYAELRFETISNPKLLNMLERHGYMCAGHTTAEMMWDGVAVLDLQKETVQ